MNFAFDCNILISAALFPDSIPFKSLKLALRKGNVIISKQTLAELKNTFSKPKLKKYLTLKDKLSFVLKFEAVSVKVEILESVNHCCDPKDNIYLKLAISGKASCIVTGDKDLLILNSFRNIPIITPSDFLDIYDD